MENSPSANNRMDETRTLLTNDGVFLEKDVIAFTAANLEDEFTDVEQVVSTDSQLQGKCKRQTFWPSDPHGPVTVTAADRHTPTFTQETHSEAELGDAQVELSRAEVNEAEQRTKYG